MTDPASLPAWATHALGAAARGERVFPLLDKHIIPVKWGREATTDTATIRRWAREFPRATGYGIALRQDQYVFDADTAEAVAWCRTKMPRTYEVLTGRRGEAGGCHFYFHVPNGRRLRMLNTGLGALWGVPGLDGKTLGGYVVGPGSLHKSGTRYTVADDRRPAALPGPVIKKIGDRPDLAAAGDSDAGLSDAEVERFTANAQWGAALRREATGEAAQIKRQLVRYLRASDERWSDAFLDAGVRLGIYVASGALSYREAVDFLTEVYEAEDDWGTPGSNIPRSIRRGVAFGARQEESSWL